MERPLETTIEYIKGIGAARADLLKKELGIFTVGDLIGHLPFRYVDKTKFWKVRDLIDTPDLDAVQLRGVIREWEVLGEGRAKRLQARFRDDTGAIDLVWFQGWQWVEKKLSVGVEYVVYGKPTWFRERANIAHPEIEVVTPLNTERARTLEPIYPCTEKLKGRGLDSAALMRIEATLWERITPDWLPENLPTYLLEQFGYVSRFEAYKHLHFPPSEAALAAAVKRLKFEELFLMQLRILQLRGLRNRELRGFVFTKVGDNFNNFFFHHLPFELTNAQKRVLREIRKDVGTGKQMNRLVQGDVGSGKTVVALMAMLLALDNDTQACLMAPTEILAGQHFEGICALVKGLGLRVAMLTGSVKGKARKQILAMLASGDIHIVIGTHALIEETVEFRRLGLAVIDEQHRFGVAQRAALWKKNAELPPHILVMSATPIPRTLAMTLYGDLDVSVIDELPPGRKPITTIHKYESQRERVMGIIREEISKGRQAYIVYPLIEENDKLELQSLMEGFEAVQTYFAPPEYQISMLHGKMKPADKDAEMERFVKGVTNIMVATTVIEVGVNVPNATVMVVENTERFGLSQLHQLRGRVGRGGEQSYCILLSGNKLSTDGRARIETMCRTNNGFEIAEADMKLRGSGDLQGTQQSGIINFKLADLTTDGELLITARSIAVELLTHDLTFEKPEHACLRDYFEREKQHARGWARIS